MSGFVARWFTQKYTLPTTHDAFLRQSEAEWLEEMYVDIYYEQAAAIEALKRVGSLALQPRDQEIERNRLRAEIARLAEVLGEAAPLPDSERQLDEVDRQIAAGQEVDLNALLPKGMKIREAKPRA